MTTPPPVAPVVTDEMALSISLDVDRLEKELDITNADYIALWLASAGKMPISFLACQIADAYDRASAVASGELERLKEALELAIAANCKMKDALSFYADDGPTPNVDGPWKATSWDFGAFARCTLADVANIEGGKNP